jgi:hypothetical protein
MPYRDAQPEFADLPDVTVAIYDAPHEAHLAVLHLDTLGISARTLNEMVVGMAPHLGGGLGGIRVSVRAEDAPEAHFALEKLRRELAEERGERRAKAAAAQNRPQRSKSRTFAAFLFIGVALMLWFALRLR